MKPITKMMRLLMPYVLAFEQEFVASTSLKSCSFSISRNDRAEFFPAGSKSASILAGYGATGGGSGKPNEVEEFDAVLSAMSSEQGNYHPGLRPDITRKQTSNANLRSFSGTTMMPFPVSDPSEAEELFA